MTSGSTGIADGVGFGFGFGVVEGFIFTKMGGGWFHFQWRGGWFRLWFSCG